MSRNSHLLLSLPGAVLASVALLSTMPLAAQTASYTYIDQKAPYKNSGMLTALNLPKVGTTFKVQVPNGGDTCTGWCLSGCSRVNYYLAIGVRNPNVPIPAMGGFLFTSADVVVPVPWGPTPQQGTVTMSFKIPNSQELLGVRFYQQVLREVWTWGWWYPPALSRGGVGVIGK